MGAFAINLQRSSYLLVKDSVCVFPLKFALRRGEGEKGGNENFKTKRKEPLTKEIP